MSSDYESVRLSDDDKEFFEQIEIRNGKSEIKEYRSLGERFSTFCTNLLYCSWFDDDEFMEHKNVKKHKKQPYKMVLREDFELEHDDSHIKLLSSTKHKKRSSNNSRATDDEEEHITLSPPPPDSTRELSSDSEQEDDENNEIISLPVQTIKPKTPPVSSSSSSEEKVFIKPSPPPLFAIDEEHSSSSSSEEEEHDQKTSICVSSIHPSLVPKTITFIAEQKKEIMNLKNEYTKSHNRLLLSKDNDKAKSLEKKIALVLDLITWCSRLIDNMNTFLKELGVYKNKENVFITYDISEYCSEIRSYFEKKTYINFLRQDEGFEDLAIIRHLPVIYVK